MGIYREVANNSEFRCDIEIFEKILNRSLWLRKVNVTIFCAIRLLFCRELLG